VTGRIRWRKEPVSGLRVTEDAIFSTVCEERKGCTLTRHDRYSGRPRWSIRDADPWLTEDDTGARAPFTPATGSYLLSGLHEDDQGVSAGARDTKTGRLTRARVPGWLQGLGEDWAAIGHSPHRPTVNDLRFAFIRF
jgi:hypothetical protein